MADYLYLVDQATFEAGDLLLSVGDEQPGSERYREFAATLEQQLRDLQTRITDGSYQFADDDLPFMVVLRRFESAIPFADLLEAINETHRGGLAG